MLSKRMPRNEGFDCSGDDKWCWSKKALFLLLMKHGKKNSPEELEMGWYNFELIYDPLAWQYKPWISSQYLMRPQLLLTPNTSTSRFFLQKNEIISLYIMIEYHLKVFLTLWIQSLIFLQCIVIFYIII